MPHVRLAARTVMCRAVPCHRLAWAITLINLDVDLSLDEQATLGQKMCAAPEPCVLLVRVTRADGVVPAAAAWPVQQARRGRVQNSQAHALSDAAHGSPDPGAARARAASPPPSRSCVTLRCSPRM